MGHPLTGPARVWGGTHCAPLMPRLPRHAHSRCRVTDSAKARALKSPEKPNRQGQIRQAGCGESPHWRGRRMWSSESKVILKIQSKFEVSLGHTRSSLQKIQNKTKQPLGNKDRKKTLGSSKDQRSIDPIPQPNVSLTELTTDKLSHRDWPQILLRQAHFVPPRSREVVMSRTGQPNRRI